MLFTAVIIILNIYISLCAPNLTPDLQIKFDDLLKSIANMDAFAFRAIFESITQQSEQMIIAQSFILRGRQDLFGRHALEYFVDYWYANRPGPVYEEGVAQEAFGRIFTNYFPTLDQHDNSPLHLVMQFRETSLVRLWIDAKMNLDVTNSAGKTALLVAIEMANEKHVALLVDAGANTRLCDANGKCALAYAHDVCNMEIIVKLCEKITLSDVGQVMASIFSTRDENFILYVIKEIHVNILNHQMSMCAPNNENRVAFSRWSCRLADFITIWKDLLRHLYDSHHEGFEPTPMLVLVHVKGGVCGYVTIETIGDLHRLMTPDGGSGMISAVPGNTCSAVAASSSTTMLEDTQVAMMSKIALLGSGVQGLERTCRIFINRLDDTTRPRFEVVADDTNGERRRYSFLLPGDSMSCVTSSDACDGQYPPPYCHSGPCRASTCDTDSPSLPDDHRLDDLRQLFGSMEIGSASAFTEARASHDTSIMHGEQDEEESMDCGYRCRSPHEGRALSDSDEELQRQLGDTITRLGGVSLSETTPHGGLSLRADNESNPPLLRAANPRWVDRGDDSHTDGTS